MSFAEAISHHCPFWKPRQLRGIPPETVKATMEMKLWRLTGWKTIPDYPMSEIIAYLES